MLSTLLPLAVLPLATCALTGPSVRERRAQEPRLLHLPVTTFKGAPSKDRILRRQLDVDLVPRASALFYSVDISIGTPPQAVSVNFDTGSDELWVNPVCQTSIRPALCRSLGHFNGSQTFVDAHRNGSANYVSGQVKLEYGHDYVQIGSAKISNQSFGVATDSGVMPSGVLGAAPGLLGWNSSDARVMDNLVHQGFINSRAFSLDIRSFESKGGSLIFGGLDTRKFTGALEKRPIVPASASPDGLTRYWVYLDGITVSSANGSVMPVFDRPNALAAVLDSGATISTLPGLVFDDLLAAFPEAVRVSPGTYEYQVPCSVDDPHRKISFKFGKTVIDVPYKDFIFKQDDTCFLGVVRDNFAILGDSFLRAAYVVYDWDNRNIHLANAKDCGSKLVAIGKGPDSVPSLVGECGASSTSPSSPSSQSRSAPTGTSPDPAGSPVTTAAGDTYTTVRPSVTSGRSNESARPTSTSIFTSIRTHTVTSCPQSVTSCPIGSVTTETITGTTTWRPDQSTATAPPSSEITSVFLTTMTQTVTDCHGEVPCSMGLVTTVVLTPTAYLCPEPTTTWTCRAGEDGCAPSSMPTHVRIVTVVPTTTGPEPTPVPGCTSCEMPSGIETNPVQTVSPIQTSPAGSSPAGSSPTGSSPAESTPAQTSPLGSTPAQTSPAQTSPAESSPAQTSPLGSSPAQTSPAQTSPAQTSLLQTTSPLQGPPSQTTPAQTLPTSTISTVNKPSVFPCTTCGFTTSGPKPPVVAGATLWRAPSITALALGALVVAAM